MVITNRTRLGGSAALVGLFSVGLLLGGCDSPTGTGGPPILIPNQWTNTRDEFHRLNLASPDEGTTSGVFSGTEDLDFDENPLGGHWSNGRVVMTIVRGSRTPKFVATVSRPLPDTLVFVADPANATRDSSFTVFTVLPD